MFKPLHSGLVVQIELMTRSTTGAIILSQSQMNPFVKIIAKGDGVKSSDIVVGSYGLLNPSVSPMPIIGGDEKAYFLIKEYDILAVYDNPPTADMIATVMNEPLMSATISRDNTKFIDTEVVNALKAKKNTWKNADISEVEPSKIVKAFN